MKRLRVIVKCIREKGRKKNERDIARNYGLRDSVCVKTIEG